LVAQGAASGDRRVTDALILAIANPLEHVVQHPYVQVGPVTLLSNQIIMQVLAAALLVMIVPRAITKTRDDDDIGRLVPIGVGNFFDGICQFLRTQVVQPALGQHTDRFVKYVWSVFFFILFCNLIGLLPFNALFGLVGLKVHVTGTPTGNIWVTGTLAVCTMLMMIVNGLRLGGLAYLAHFCPGPVWLAPLLVPVELIGLVAKIFALAMRLFANMIAGHILLAVLISFVGMAAGALGTLGGLAIAVPVVLGSVAINLLEIFVAFLQAFIFTFLTALFIGQSVVLHHDDHGHKHDAHGAPAGDQRPAPTEEAMGGTVSSTTAEAHG
jgi:F-type H+-transporting ATPase subunit a